MPPPPPLAPDADPTDGPSIDVVPVGPMVVNRSVALYRRRQVDPS